MWYQTVQASQKNAVNERINQRELLFQTICDIANNKEIQRIILKSQISRGVFPVSAVPVVTRNHLRQMYIIGMLLSKIISTSRIQSIVQQYQLLNSETQQGVSAVIEKDATLKEKISQLSNLECDCENDNTMNWSFPVICVILNYIQVFCFVALVLFGPIIQVIVIIFSYVILFPLWDLLNCKHIW